jgi:hypothetical protein
MSAGTESGRLVVESVLVATAVQCSASFTLAQARSLAGAEYAREPNAPMSAKQSAIAPILTSSTEALIAGLPLPSYQIVALGEIN